MRFGLAAMCPLIRGLTVVMTALPVMFLVAGTVGPRAFYPTRAAGSEPMPGPIPHDDPDRDHPHLGAGHVTPA